MSGFEQAHVAQPRRLAIKGDKLFRPNPARGGHDHHVGKAVTIVAIKLDREAEIIGALDIKLRRGQKAVKCSGNLDPIEPIGAFQNPDEFDQNLTTHKALRSIRQAINYFRSDARLSGIVLNQIADQNIGIEGDHLVSPADAVAPAAIAASISSSDAGGVPFRINAP